MNATAVASSSSAASRGFEGMTVIYAVIVFLVGAVFVDMCDKGTRIGRARCLYIGLLLVDVCQMRYVKLSSSTSGVVVVSASGLAIHYIVVHPGGIRHIVVVTVG